MNDVNFKHIESNFYICYTQAGFKKAVKHYNEMNIGSKYALEDLKGYPKSYPSIVVFSWEYTGYHFIRANCIHVNKLGRLYKN